jgi:hypothetical protein
MGTPSSSLPEVIFGTGAYLYVRNLLAANLFGSLSVFHSFRSVIWFRFACVISLFAASLADLVSFLPLLQTARLLKTPRRPYEKERLDARTKAGRSSTD